MVNKPSPHRRQILGQRAVKALLGTSLVVHATKIFTSYLATAHRRTSKLSDLNSIAGGFAKGDGTMKTFNPELTFLMESRDDHSYQTAIRQKNGRTIKHAEQIDLVIGWATRGQTYLYWTQNGLFELRLSYRTKLHKWVNSPGYVYCQRRLDCDSQRMEEAAKEFRRVISLDSTFMRAYDNLGLSLAAMGESEALQTYGRAQAVDRERKIKSPWPPVNVGMLLVQLWQDEAEPLFRETMRFDPCFAAARHRLGTLLERQGKTSQAIEELKRASELESGKSPAALRSGTHLSSRWGHGAGEARDRNFPDLAGALAGRVNNFGS